MSHKSSLYYINESNGCKEPASDVLQAETPSFWKTHTILLAACLCSLFLCMIRVTSRTSGRLPPGPRGIPLIGSILDLRAAKADPSCFAKWALSLATYGEMTTVRLGTRTWVMLNSPRVARCIISGHAAVTGDRPDFPVAGTLVSKDKRTVLRKTRNWLEGRKLMHRLLSGSSVGSYTSIQEEESVKMLHGYLHAPRQWNQHHYDYAYSVMHRIVLGERTKHPAGQLRDFQRVTAEFLQSICSSLFEFFPGSKVCRPFLRYWAEMGDDHYAVFKQWWDPVARDIDTGVAPPSFARDAMRQSNTKYARDHDEAMYLSTSIVAAGSDNVRRTQNVVMMAAICHPGIFAQARSMIDTVCGSQAQRLPAIDDMASLPYISAILKECLRWRPVVPLIPQHHSTSAFRFEGYTFPAGTDFVINSLAVSASVPNPTAFRPDRWTGNEDNIIDGLWQFGGGRRICVGYKIAHQELFLAIARSLYCFDFSAVGPVNSARLRHDVIGEPFPVRIMVRSQAHADLITAVYDRL